MSEWLATKWGRVSTLIYGKALAGYARDRDDLPARVYGTNGPIGSHLEAMHPGERVVIGRKGAYRGVHYAPGPFWVIDTAYYLDHDETIDARWASYALRNTDINGLRSGSAIPSTTREDFYALDLLLPPLVEQRAIAEVLGALDDKIAINDKTAGTAIALSNALYAAQGESFNERRSLGDLAASGVLALSDGYRTKRSEHGRPGLRILRAGDIREGQMLPEGEDFVGESYIRQIGGKASEVGDILLTTKGTVGRVAVVPRGTEQVVYSPQICYFRVQDSTVLDGAVLAAWFRSDDFKRQASTVMFKSDMAPYISLTDIRAMSVPIPSAEVLNAIRGAHAALLDRFSQANRENLVLKGLRDAMLPQLMSGKIRVRDAERVVEGVV